MLFSPIVLQTAAIVRKIIKISTYLTAVAFRSDISLKIVVNKIVSEFGAEFFESEI